MANNNYSNKSYIVSINSNFRVENGQRTIRIFTNDGRYHDIIIPTDSGSSSKKNSASQVSIASNGNWEIDGKDTGQKSQGEKGESGTNGTNGKTWRPSVDENGNLTWSENDSDETPNSSNIKGEKGDKGDQGIQGIQGEKGEDGSSGIIFSDSPDEFGISDDWHSLGDIFIANSSQSGWYLITPGIEGGYVSVAFSMYRTDGKDKINGYGTSASNSAYGKYIKVYMSADTSAITQIEYSWSSTYSGTYQVRTIGLDNKAYMSVNTAMTLIAYCGDEEPLYW